MKTEDLLIIIENINKTQLQPMTARKHLKAANYSEVVKKQFGDLHVCRARDPEGKTCVFMYGNPGNETVLSVSDFVHYTCAFGEAVQYIPQIVPRQAHEGHVIYAISPVWKKEFNPKQAESYAYIDDVNIYNSKPKGKIFTFENKVVPWYKWLWNYLFKKKNQYNFSTYFTETF